MLPSVEKLLAEIERISGAPVLVHEDPSMTQTAGMIYLLRDRDGIYGAEFTKRVTALGIEEKPIAPRAPWQNPYVERLSGTLRRECLDHVIVIGERHLQRVLENFFKYYHHSRPHRSLTQDSPVPRPVMTPEQGPVVEFPQVGGLHHLYIRQAA